MALKVTRVDVWAGEIQDQPGGLSRVLRAIADAGGNLACVIARREQSRPGTGVVFVTPVTGSRVQAAARGAGLSPAANVATLRVDGPDAPGLGARMTEALATAGINVRGVSAAVVGRNFVAYVGLDDAADADAAAAALRGVKSGSSGRGGGRTRGAAKRSSGAGKRAAGGAKRSGRSSGKRATARRR